MIKIITVVLLVAILVVNVILLFEVKDRVDDLNQDPLQRGAQHYDLEYCSCSAEDGVEIFFNQTRTWQVIENENSLEDIPKINFSLFNIS